LEVESGLGREALDETASVLHPRQSGLHQPVSWSRLCFVRSASDLFRRDHAPSTGLNSGAYGGAGLLVRGIQQAGQVGLGEALAPALDGAALEVDAVDQPRPAAGLRADQRGRRDTFGALAVTCLVLEADPGAQVRRSFL
jgi:hypothetical protein